MGVGSVVCRVELRLRENAHYYDAVGKGRDGILVLRPRTVRIVL